MINTSGKFKNLCLNIINNIKNNPKEEENKTTENDNNNTSTNENCDKKYDIKNDVLKQVQDNKEIKQNEELSKDLDKQLNLTHHIITDQTVDNNINKNNTDKNVGLNQTDKYNFLQSESDVNGKNGKNENDDDKNGKNESGDDKNGKNESNDDKNGKNESGDDDKYNETNCIVGNYINLKAEKHENDSKELCQESIKGSNEHFNTTIKEPCNNITTDLNFHFKCDINNKNCYDTSKKKERRK